MDIEEALLSRCNSKCELCTSSSDLITYEVPPANYSDNESKIVICEICHAQIENQKTVDTKHWHCLSDSMWSTVPAVQVMAWRILKSISSESWAIDLLDMLYLEDELQKWAESAQINLETAGDDIALKTVDSNGTELLGGDTVTLIKDLVVKGANFTAKRGTTVRNISLTSNPEHVEGKVNGTHIVLLSCFLKKAN